MPTRSPTRLEVLDKWREGVLRDLRVALPARVEKYDASTQLADLKPLLQDVFQDEDDSYTSISIPVVTNVPVQWLGGGAGHVTCPLAVGDTVTMLCHDRSLDAWLAQGGEQAPTDLRRHNISDAVALVGLHDNQHPVSGVPTDGVAMWMDGGQRVKVTASAVELGQSATDAVALASKVDAIVTALLGAISAALGASATPTTAFTAMQTYLVTTHPPAPTGSTTVKVQP